MLGVIDRFENNFAVIERDDGKMMNIPVSSLPEGVKEGDVLDIEGKIIKLNKEETLKRRKEIEEFIKDIWK